MTPKMSKDFTRTCKMFPKRTTQEKILQIANYMVEEDIDLMTLLLSTRKTVIMLNMKKRF